MLGALCGNIAGSRFLYERSEDYSREEMFQPPASLTDTGRLLIEFAHLVLKHEGEPAILRADLTSKSYPSLSLAEYSLLGATAESPYELKELLQELSPSHTLPELGIALASFWAAQGKTKETILERIEEDYFKVYQLGTEMEAPHVRLIAAFMSSTDFPSAIWRAVEFSGSGEDLATAMGPLAQAYYGMDEETGRMVRRLLNPSGRKLIRLWSNRYPTKPSDSLQLLTKYQHHLSRDQEVDHFVREFYYYAMKQAKVDLSDYQTLLQDAGLEWTEACLRQADVSNLETGTVLALIMSSLRADYFSPGLLRDFIDDGVIDRWLGRLSALSVGLPLEPMAQVTRLRLELQANNSRDVLWFDDESLEMMSQVEGLIEQKMSYRVKDRWLVGRLDDLLNEAGRLVVRSDWDETITNPDHPQYQLIAELVDGTTIKYQGQYDRAHMPDDNWHQLTRQVREFIMLLGFGRAVSLFDFDTALKPGEVKYCGVEFDDYGKIYHYLTYDMNIKVGDRVIVPAGPANIEKEVTVRTIEFCHWDDTPYPLEDTKLILRRADEEMSEKQKWLPWRPAIGNDEEPEMPVTEFLT